MSKEVYRQKIKRYPGGETAVSLGISYMGTKRQLASAVNRLVSDCKEGPFLDVFAGMCAVGTAVAPTRQVWSNDLQHFAVWVASARFCSKSSRPDEFALVERCRLWYLQNRATLEKRFRDNLAKEERALSQRNVGLLADFFEIAHLEANQVAKRNNLSRRHDLFTRRFGGTYFSTRQAISIDSIRFALDRAYFEDVISSDLHRWAIIALGIALSKCATTTGHFAQPLFPNSNNLTRFIAQRRRDIWGEWIGACRGLNAVGSSHWRRKNRVFRDDAIDLLETLTTKKTRPSVVYADPPYTKDQYSRYYHIYETAVLYDHPLSIGRGLYRDDRELSAFCQKSKIDIALEELIRRCAELRADLILSYPTNGLYTDSRQRIPELMKRFFRKPATALEFSHAHSTMGASKGPIRSAVTEVIYRVYA